MKFYGKLSPRIIFSGTLLRYALGKSHNLSKSYDKSFANNLHSCCGSVESLGSRFGSLRSVLLLGSVPLVAVLAQVPFSVTDLDEKNGHILLFTVAGFRFVIERFKKRWVLFLWDVRYIRRYFPANIYLVGGSPIRWIGWMFQQAVRRIS